MKRRALIGIGLLMVVGLGAYARAVRGRHESLERARAVPSLAPYVRPARPWRWPTESEWVAHDVVRTLVSWSAHARGEDPAATHLAVTRTGGDAEPPVLFVDLTGPRGRSRLTIQPATHIWDPDAYVDAARTLLGDSGAASGPAPDVGALLLAADTRSLRRADALLFVALSDRPRDPGLHEQAALLWGAHALRESGDAYADPRPFLNGVVAHLALSRALRGAGDRTTTQQIASAIADIVVQRQVEAMATLDRVDLDVAADAAAWRPWTHGLRLRITFDPRLISTKGGATRFEMLESVKALDLSHSCREALRQAAAWRLPPAAEWIRPIAPGCSRPEFDTLVARDLALQIEDAAQLGDADAATPEATFASLGAAAAANTHQPMRPTAIVPAHTRAEAAWRHLIGALSLQIDRLRALAQPQQVQELTRATEAMRAHVPQRVLLDLALRVGSQMQPDRNIPPDLCPGVANLIKDRPDLVPRGRWQIGSFCPTQEPLRMVRVAEWIESKVVPQTGLVGHGPWRGIPSTKEGLEAAWRHAPWIDGVADLLLRSAYALTPPTAELRRVYGKLLDYNLRVMALVAGAIHDDDDEVQRLAERICEIDAEACGGWAGYFAGIGRDEAAEGMFKRAMASAHDVIGLSTDVGWYVKILLDRGDAGEAIRIARAAAGVYSRSGLFTLGYVYERLGRFRDASQEYARISQRYEDATTENMFYVRYRFRHGTDAFREEGDRAMATLFPKGLVRKSVEDFKREGHHGGVEMQSVEERLRRAGVREEDFLVAVDGFVVENEAQMNTVLTLTDAPTLTAIVLRKRGLIEVSGPYNRWNFRPVKAPGPATTSG